LSAFDEFKREAKTDHALLKGEVGNVSEFLVQVNKGMQKDIRDAVNKQVERMRTSMEKGLDLDETLVEAYSEDKSGGVGKCSSGQQSSMKKDDITRELKVQLIDMLNSRASQEDLNQVKFDKTNKDDTDMVMKCIDIMHKQMTQVATIILELIKQGIVTKFENETEK